MKYIFILVALLTSITGLCFAQDNQQKDGLIVYTFFGNYVEEPFHFPLIGFVNIARGSHSSPQIGFVNLNQRDFRSLQFGFVNLVGGDMTGLQFGFVNTTIKSFHGTQFGFINLPLGEEVHGLQFGYVNTTINKFNGLQFGFSNTTRYLNGMQFGFVNYADTVEKGIPIGFLSIVRHGGYMATELGTSEIAPLNASFKIGVDAFYTTFVISYNPSEENTDDQFLFGAGFGSIIPMGKSFYINPELTTYNRFNDNLHLYVSLAPLLGYNINPNLSIVAGPSVLLAYTDKGEDIKEPFFNIIEHNLNDDNNLYLGARIALRFRW